MLRRRGSALVPTCTHPTQAGETCTCNGRTSPRAWERGDSAPESWIDPRSSRHPTSLKPRPGRGIALPASLVGNASRCQSRAPSTQKKQICARRALDSNQEVSSMELHRSARVTRVHESDAIAVAGGCTSRSVARSVCALFRHQRVLRGRSVMKWPMTCPVPSSKLGSSGSPRRLQPKTVS